MKPMSQYPESHPGAAPSPLHLLTHPILSVPNASLLLLTKSCGPCGTVDVLAGWFVCQSALGHAEETQ